MPSPVPAPEAVLAARSAVEDSLRELQPGDRVLVAASGGPDSLALAAATGWVASRLGISAGAVVIDHGLQDGSAQIADWAQGLCKRLGLDPVLVEQVVVGTEGGPESAARDARYAALTAIAEREGAAAVLLGHTREDQAETVLLRLARGSGARSLSAMRSTSGLWRRPFLHLQRDLVHEAASWSLAELGEQAWRDPHNEDPRFARSRLRALWPALLEALGPGLVAGLARSADQARDDADALDLWADRVLASGAVSDAIEIAVEELAAVPRAVRTRVIRAMIARAGAPMDDVDYGHVLAVERLVSDWRGQGPVSLPGRLGAGRTCGRVRIDRKDEGGR